VLPALTALPKLVEPEVKDEPDDCDERMAET
jgi:hypothetical protein